jgi:imidazolonepropionase-like amidohydrolase
VAAGVRSIEHGSLIDAAGIAAMRAAGTVLVADVWNGDWIDTVGRAAGWPAETLRKNTQTTQAQRTGFRAAVRAGVKIGFGTDAGVFPHGLNAAQFALMVRWGQTPMQAIASATSGAADTLGQAGTLGCVAVGCAADLLAVAGDPRRNIRTLEHPAAVVQGGVRVR